MHFLDSTLKLGGIVFVGESEEASVCEVIEEGMVLGHVSKFKYMKFVLDESGCR